MGTLNNISGQEAAKAFRRAGWIVKAQVGSHLILTKPGERANLAIPQHREVALGTLRGLLRAAGITVDQFLALL